MPSVGVLLLNQSPEHRRGADSAALQIGRHGVRAVHRTGGDPRRGRHRRSGPLPAAIVASVAVFPLWPCWPCAVAGRAAAPAAEGARRRLCPGVVMTYLDLRPPCRCSRGPGRHERAAGPGGQRLLAARQRSRRPPLRRAGAERLAEALGARPSEVLSPAAAPRATTSPSRACSGRAGTPTRSAAIVVSPAEHHAVLDSVEWLAKHDGADVTWIAVEPTGRVTRRRWPRRSATVGTSRSRA